VSPKLRRGVWLHRCLQLADEGKEWQDELYAMENWARDHDVPAEQIDSMTVDVRDLVQDYLAYWSGARGDEAPGPWEVVDTEVKVAWQATPRLCLTSTIDVLRRDRQGRVWIWERKSTQEIPDSNWRTVDPQTMLQFIEARKSGVPVVGIVFDYICTRPGAQLRVRNDGALYRGDEERRTRARYFKATEAEMRSKGASEEYIESIRQRVVADGEWFQRYLTLRPDDNAELTLRDVASVAGRIIESDKRGYYARSINLLDCRLFCPYGKLCMHEYQLGRQSPAMREEYMTLQTEDLYAAGRSEW
jgi:hypothetical protein